MKIVVITVGVAAFIALPLLFARASRTGGLDRWQERQRAWANRHPRAAPWARSFSGGAAGLLLFAVGVAVWDVVGEPALSPWVLIVMGLGYAILMRVVIAAAVGAGRKREPQPHD